MSQHRQTAFSDVLLRLMAERHMSLRALAKLVNYDVGYLSKIRNGHKRASRELAGRLDKALNAGGALIAAASALSDSASPDSPMPGFADPGADWLGVEGGSAPVARGLAGPDLSSVLRTTAADVVVMRGMLAAFTASERQFGGASVRPHAMEYLRRVVVSRLRAGADEAVFRDLCAVAVEFSLRVSSMQLDAGYAAASRGFLGSALPWAERAGSPAMVAWVLARFGELDMGEGNAERALAYTSGAASMAERASPRAKSFILAKHALALSMTGDKARTLLVLGQAQDSYCRAGSREEPAWMSFYGVEHLQHDQGRCLNNLGMGDGAVDAAQESMLGRRLARQQAFSLAVQAIGYVLGGDKAVDKACEIGHELAAVTAQLDSGRLKLALAQVLDALRPYQEAATVRDLAEAARPVLARVP